MISESISQDYQKVASYTSLSSNQSGGKPVDSVMSKYKVFGFSISGAL